jgi:hypothetical protein
MNDPHKAENVFKILEFYSVFPPQHHVVSMILRPQATCNSHFSIFQNSTALFYSLLPKTIQYKNSNRQTF